MTAVISKMKVESYEKWREAWNSSRAVRAAGGTKSAMVLRDPAAPNALTIITCWENASKAQEFVEKNKTRIATHAAPGTAPDWTLLDEALTETY
jgi:heme-degrading monooxygenase HmoA